MVIFVDLPYCTYWFFEHHQFWKVNTYGFAVSMNTGYVQSSLVNNYHLLCVLFMCVSDTKRRPLFSAQIILFTTVQYMASIMDIATIGNEAWSAPPSHASDKIDCSVVGDLCPFLECDMVKILQGWSTINSGLFSLSHEIFLQLSS